MQRMIPQKLLDGDNMRGVSTLFQEVQQARNAIEEEEKARRV